MEREMGSSNGLAKWEIVQMVPKKQIVVSFAGWRDERPRKQTLPDGYKKCDKMAKQKAKPPRTIQFKGEATQAKRSSPGEQGPKTVARFVKLEVVYILGSNLLLL